MSSRAKKLEAGIQRPEVTVDTVDVTVKISLNLHCYNPDGDLPKDTFVTVQKVPKDQLDLVDLIKHAAESTFINCVNTRKFLEVYEPGKSAKDSEPELYNLSKWDVIQVKEVTIIK